MCWNNLKKKLQVKIESLKPKKLPIWIVLSSIAFLIFIQVFYTIPAKSKWFDAVWEPGDLISFAGTIVLGIIAVQQTWDANAMNRRLMQLEENRYKLEVRPFVMLKSWGRSYQSRQQIHMYPDELYIDICPEIESEAVLCIELELTNTTQSYVSVEYHSAEYFDEQKLAWNVTYVNISDRKLRLNPSDCKKMVFYGEYAKMFEQLNGKRIRFKFTLENRFGEVYQENFDTLFVICDLHNNPEIWLPHIEINTFNYRIGKWDYNNAQKPVLIWEDTTNGQT